MIQAEEAIAVRQAAIRESRAQANYHNLQNLRKLKNETDGALDQRTIQNALGKCPRGNECGDYPVQLSSVYTLL